MKNMIKRIITLALAVLMVMLLCNMALAAGGETYISGAAVVKTGYTVTFSIGAEAVEAGVAVPENMVVAKDSVLKVDDLPNAIWETREEPVLPVKCMVGWYLDEGLTRKVEGDTVVTDNMTLYAMWGDHIPGCCDECEGFVGEVPCACFCHAVPLAGQEIDGSGSFILVKKVFAGLPGRAYVPSGFTISVTPNPSGTPITRSLGEAIKVSEDGFEYTWKIPASAGSYTIGESQTDITLDSSYVLTGAARIGQSVTVETPVATIMRDPVDYPSCSGAQIPFKQEAGQGWILAIAQNKPTACVVILSEYDLSESVKNGIKAFTDYPNNSYEHNNGSTVTFYTVPSGGGTVTVPGTTVTFTYHPGDHYIDVSETKDWRQACSLGFSMSEFYNPDITVINTYTKKTTEVTIRKDITGSMGDVSRQFAIYVTFNKPIGFDDSYEVLDQNGNVITEGEGYTVKFILGENNGQPGSITIKDVPTDAQITGIRETDLSGNQLDGGWKMNLWQPEIGEGNGVSLPIAVGDDGLTLTVENNKEGTPDTGVFLDSLPYILILGVVAVGAVLLLRRRRDDD